MERQMEIEVNEEMFDKICCKCCTHCSNMPLFVLIIDNEMIEKKNLSIRRKICRKKEKIWKKLHKEMIIYSCFEKRYAAYDPF